MNKRQLYKGIIATTVATSAVVAGMPATQASTPFTDLHSSADYYAPVLELAERGIVKGYEDGTYKPANRVTRAQAAKIIAKTLKLQAIEPATFSDVAPDSDFAPYIAALTEAGIVKGYDDGTFRPNQTVTRSQMAKMLAIGFELEAKAGNSLPFTDVKPETETYAYVKALYEAGITKGKTATQYAPNEPVLRGQLASFVIRAEKTVAPTEQQATVEGFTQDTLTLSAGTYAIPNEMAAIFTQLNADALAEASITYTEKAGQIIDITAITLNASGEEQAPVVFDAAGEALPFDLTISGQYMTVQNAILQHDLMIGHNVTTAFSLQDAEIQGEIIVEEDNNVTASLFAEIGKKPAPHIYIKNSILPKMTMNRNDVTLTADQPIGQIIVAESVTTSAISATVEQLEVRSASTFELKGAPTVQSLEIVNEPTAFNSDGLFEEFIVNKVAALVIGGTPKITALKLQDEAKLTLSKDIIIEQVTIASKKPIVLDGEASINKVTIESDAQVALNTTGAIKEVETTNADADITLSENTKVDTVTVPEDVKAEDIIKQPTPTPTPAPAPSGNTTVQTPAFTGQSVELSLSDFGLSAITNIGVSSNDMDKIAGRTMNKIENQDYGYKNVQLLSLAPNTTASFYVYGMSLLENLTTYVWRDVTIDAQGNMALVDTLTNYTTDYTALDFLASDIIAATVDSADVTVKLLEKEDILSLTSMKSSEKPFTLTATVLRNEEEVTVTRKMYVDPNGEVIEGMRYHNDDLTLTEDMQVLNYGQHDVTDQYDIFYTDQQVGSLRLPITIDSAALQASPKHGKYALLIGKETEDYAVVNVIKTKPADTFTPDTVKLSVSDMGLSAITNVSVASEDMDKLSAKLTNPLTNGFGYDSFELTSEIDSFTAHFFVTGQSLLEDHMASIYNEVKVDEYGKIQLVNTFKNKTVAYTPLDFIASEIKNVHVTSTDVTATIENGNIIVSTVKPSNSVMTLTATVVRNGQEVPVTRKMYVGLDGELIENLYYEAGDVKLTQNNRIINYAGEDVTDDYNVFYQDSLVDETVRISYDTDFQGLDGKIKDGQAGKYAILVNKQFPSFTIQKIAAPHTPKNYTLSLAQDFKQIDAISISSSAIEPMYKFVHMEPLAIEVQSQHNDQQTVESLEVTGFDQNGHYIKKYYAIQPAKEGALSLTHLTTQFVEEGAVSYVQTLGKIMRHEPLEDIKKGIFDNLTYTAFWPVDGLYRQGDEEALTAFFEKFYNAYNAYDVVDYASIRTLLENVYYELEVENALQFAIEHPSENTFEQVRYGLEKVKNASSKQALTEAYTTAYKKWTDTPLTMTATPKDNVIVVAFSKDVDRNTQLSGSAYQVMHNDKVIRVQSTKLVPEGIQLAFANSEALQAGNYTVTYKNDTAHLEDAFDINVEPTVTKLQLASEQDEQQLIFTFSQAVELKEEAQLFVTADYTPLATVSLTQPAADTIIAHIDNETELQLAQVTELTLGNIFATQYTDGQAVQQRFDFLLNNPFER